MWGHLENENAVLYKDCNMIQHNSNIRAARSLSLCPFFCMNNYIVLISSLKNKMGHMLSYGKSPETLYQLIFCQSD